MVRRWCVPLAGAALVAGSVAASAPAAAAGRAPHTAGVHQVRPGGRMVRPGVVVIVAHPAFTWAAKRLGCAAKRFWHPAAQK